jgi:hypothetical protein
MGRTSSYQTTLDLPWVQDGTKPESEKHTNIWADGLQATSLETAQNGQRSESSGLPDGTSHSDTLTPDPVWGVQVPVTKSETLTLGDLTMNLGDTRVTTLSTSTNPFSVASHLDTEMINGRNYTSNFTSSNLAYVNTSPEQRTATIGLDSLERIASTQYTGLKAINFSYDSHGRLGSITQGKRHTTFGYDLGGFLAGITDPLLFTTSFKSDSDGRVLQATLPDGSSMASTMTQMAI